MSGPEPMAYQELRRAELKDQTGSETYVSMCEPMFHSEKDLFTRLSNRKEKQVHRQEM
jgi:23S rRNA A1618 N6-methylase RlmF